MKIDMNNTCVMRLAKALPAFAFLAVNLITGSADATQPPVLLRYGDHPGFGRIVIDIEAGDSIPVEQTENVVKVHISTKIKIPAAPAPRNVVKLTDGPDILIIEFAPGAQLRRSVVNGHLVIDALDRQSDAAKPQAAAPQSVPAKRVDSGTNQARRVSAEASGPASSSQPMRPEINSPVKVAAKTGGDPGRSPIAKVEEATVKPDEILPIGGKGPQGSSAPVDVVEAPMTALSLAAVSERVPEFGPGHLLSLPFGPDVGVAAFRRGDEAILVFDEQKPIDLQALKNDAIFSKSSVQLLPNATVLRIKLTAPSELRLDRTPRAWSITAIGGDAVGIALKPIALEEKEGKITLNAEQPGLVISLPDTITGGVLQVGVQRLAGQGVAVTRRTPDFRLLPTWQGVVVEALSDGIALRPAASGFSIGPEGADSRLSSSQPDPAAVSLADASHLSRIFDFPNLKTDSLFRRMQGAVVAAASIPAPSRSTARQAVAEAMMALGMAPEAQSVLELDAATDARAEQVAATLALSGAAALLSGRLSVADGLDDRRLDGSDEIALWRALKTSLQFPDNAAAAEVLANTAPLLLSYPPGLLQRLLPQATEAMVLGGQPTAAQKILEARGDDTSLGLARAFLRERKGGNPAEAIAMFQKLAVSPDRLIRLRAARAAAELQLATGQADAGKTAQALGKLLYAWRGDEREIELRLRVAQLNASAGDWRSSLQILRETAQLWPERGDQLKARMMSTFAESVSPTSQSNLKAFDLVTLAEENADLMPDGDVGLRLAEHITNALAELDLPGRASPYVEKMIAASPKGVARAVFGGRLAKIRMDQGDIPGAMEALKSTVSETMPPELLESRTLVFASSVARLGDMESAVNALIQLDTAAGDLRLADLAEQARRWPDAVTAMRRIVERSVPASGRLPENQAAMLLRLASAAAEAGDTAVLGQLRARDVSTLPPGRTADLLQLILNRPIGGVADLPRASREMIAARTLASATPQLSR